jgi:hypothetical protein
MHGGGVSHKQLNSIRYHVCFYSLLPVYIIKKDDSDAIKKTRSHPHAIQLTFFPTHHSIHHLYDVHGLIKLTCGPTSRNVQNIPASHPPLSRPHLCIQAPRWLGLCIFGPVSCLVPPMTRPLLAQVTTVEPKVEKIGKTFPGSHDDRWARELSPEDHIDDYDSIVTRELDWT